MTNEIRAAVANTIATLHNSNVKMMAEKAELLASWAGMLVGEHYIVATPDCGLAYDNRGYRTELHTANRYNIKDATSMAKKISEARGHEVIAVRLDTAYDISIEGNNLLIAMLEHKN